MDGIKLPGNWQQSLNEQAASQSACLSVFVHGQPQNTPRGAELTPFHRNRAQHRIGRSGTTDNYVSGWIYGSETFKNRKTVLCWEACWAHTGLHSLGHLPVTDESFSDWEMYKEIFVALPLAQVTREGTELRGWSGRGATTRELVLTMEKMLPRIPEQMSSSFCCRRWRWMWWRTTGSRMRRDSGRENTKVKKSFRELATSGSQRHCGTWLVWSRRGWDWSQARGHLFPLAGLEAHFPGILRHPTVLSFHLSFPLSLFKP